MLQINSLTKLACLLTAVGLATVPLASISAPAEVPLAALAHGGGIGEASFEEMSSYTALRYDDHLSASDVVARAEFDAERLGLPLVKTMSAAKLALVRGSREEVTRRLALVENLPIAGLQSTYAVDGDVHPDSLITFTGNLGIRFRSDVPEGTKQAFFAAHGLRRISEAPDGLVLVGTGLSPEVGMIAYASGLEADHDITERVIFEFALSGRPAQSASDSIQVGDAFFGLQWPIFNDGRNAAGRSDVDNDAPRAWMLNQQNGKNPFGSSDITVAIFDSGTDLSHLDLAANIDPEVGQNFVSAGSPIPTGEGIGAHGTAMASLVAGKRNDIGVVGVAPDVNIYTYRIFGPDYTTTNLRVVSALNHSIFQGPDINLHPYTISFSCTQEIVTSDMNQALRQSTESGRFGLGVANFAATGNFHSQVEFPAQSLYAIAVGAHGGSNGAIAESNWGGTGLDITMPGYGRAGVYYDYHIPGSFYPEDFVTADISGPTGSTTGDYVSLPGNLVEGSVGARFLGTSVSSALAAGTAALLLSDERYAALPPLAVFSSSLTRENRRSRYLGLEGTLLGQLVRHADLPAGRLDYYEQYNEFLGAGRPNPAAALAPITQPTETTISSGFLQEPFYSVVFGESSGINQELTPSIRPELAKGWEGNSMQASFTGFEEPVIISPYLSPVSALYFEDGAKIAQPDEMFYVWTDSLTTDVGAQESTSLNIVYNPEGTYQRDRRVTLRGPSLPDPDHGVPSLTTATLMLMEIQLGHELGVENGIVEPQDRSAPLVVHREVDSINIEMVVDGIVVSIGSVTGDSADRTKRRLCTPLSFVDIDQAPIVGRFPIWENSYDPHLDDEQMIIRTYRFIVPPIPAEATEVWFQLTLVPYMRDQRYFDQDGNERFTQPPSYLPTYRPVNDAFEQMNNVFRDHKGFVFAGMKVTPISHEAQDFLREAEYVLAGGGNYPSWSSSKNDILVAGENPEAKNWISVLKPSPIYLEEPGNLSSRKEFAPMQLLQTNEQITGMKAYAGADYVLLTTSTDSGGGSIYMMTTDGINQTKLAEVAGARDPSWAQAGDMIVFATPDSIRFLNRGTQEWSMETIITSSDEPMLTDFRSPVIDPTGSFIIFSAKRADDSSSRHNVYLSTRNGRIVSFLGLNPEGVMLPGWEQVDMYDLDLSFSGRRLLFVANAENFPTIESAAEPSNMASIFSISNFHHVLQNSDLPIYEKVEFNQLLGEEMEILSARHPRLSNEASPRIAYQAYGGPVDLGMDLTTGPDPVVVVQRIAGEYFGPPDANPPPATITPTPLPETTPVPADEARVTLTGTFDYTHTSEGWTFRTAAPAIDPALAEFQPENETRPGRLHLRSQGSNRSFGFWESPVPAIQAQPDSLYLYRAHVKASGAAAASQVPWLRLRANSRSFESAFAAETGSRGDLSLTPNTSTSRSLDLLFRPPAEMAELMLSQRSYTVAFDLKNTDPDDDPNGGFYLEKVELFRMDDEPANSVVKRAEPVFHHDLGLAMNRSAWYSGAVPEVFSAPDFFETEKGLAMSILNPANSFGFWSLDGANVPRGDTTFDSSMPTLIYRVTFRLANDHEPQLTMVPPMRVRLSTNDFQRTVEAILEPGANGALVPSPANPRNLVAFMVLEEIPAGFTHFILGFDLISSFTDRPISSLPIELEDVLIERVWLSNYPQR